MEKRISTKIYKYMHDLKENVLIKATSMNVKDHPELQELLQYVLDYENLVLKKEDFAKRKRIKLAVTLSERCCAKRANNEQCTRRRKDDTTEFCGTHLKGTPYGCCEPAVLDPNEKIMDRIQVWTQDIQGIMYYIDKHNRVYQTEDILSGISCPRIFAHWTKNEHDVYELV